ncbi:hypothetical protein GALMADRAFT_147866 [Galerina marginata CBS 339.88]|uniref:F-box domain-containing protein n=1 Tax=Galerina marginata (strain CBS 339.88) TaxID=685588 RepID=A0A067S6N4_GALM3|nr:hypothetical protein GALMADRAFT_147866 [Galerina marginata CBS 339.88]
MDLQVPDAAVGPLKIINEPLPPFHSNPDILDEICEYLAYEDDLDTEDAGISRRNLLWAALTCKAFLEPALDRLWRSLESLFPLLKILPAFIKSDGTYVLRGPISEQEWARFDWYARRIRKFSYTRDPDSLDIAMHVYFRLAQLRATPILPSLRHLHCPSTSQNDFLISGICLFLSPSLQTLEFENISNVEDKLCGTVLYTLSSDGAQMEKIILRGRGLSRDTVSMAIKFEHLRELELAGMGTALDLDIIEKIGTLPWLVDLAIDFTDSTMAPLDKDIGLKDLKSFMITAPVPFIQAFLPHIATPHLETFVAVSPTNPPVDKKDFLEEVVSRWKDTLRRIALVHQQVDENIEELNMAVLSPLLPLQKLTYLRLEGYSMELTDENIGDIARAWPDMTTLLLPFIGTGNPRPTITSLRTLAQLSPKLRHLRIPLNTSDALTFVSTGAPHTPAHDLQALTIASADDPWELRDMLHLARHIDYLFPRLRSVYPYEGHDVDRWLQVHEMIQMYQTVRQEAVAFERAKQVAVASS